MLKRKCTTCSVGTMGWHVQREAPTFGPGEQCCCECCGQPVGSPPYNVRRVEYAEDQQAEEGRAEHQMPPLLNIREALHWCKMMDEATDEMQELKKASLTHSTSLENGYCKIVRWRRARCYPRSGS